METEEDDAGEEDTGDIRDTGDTGAPEEGTKAHGEEGSGSDMASSEVDVPSSVVGGWWCRTSERAAGGGTARPCSWHRPRHTHHMY